MKAAGYALRQSRLSGKQGSMLFLYDILGSNPEILRRRLYQEIRVCPAWSLWSPTGAEIFMKVRPESAYSAKMPI